NRPCAGWSHHPLATFVIRLFNSEQSPYSPALVPWRRGWRGECQKTKPDKRSLANTITGQKKYPVDASMMGGFLFFRYLQTDRSDLLDFRAAGSKWPIVHGWIRDQLQD